MTFKELLQYSWYQPCHEKPLDFSIPQKVFIVEKGSLEFELFFILNKNDYFKYCTLKSYMETQNGLV